MVHQQSLIYQCKRTWLLSLLLAFALVLSACQPGGAGIADTGDQSPANGDVVVRVASHSELGDLLVDDNGMTLYVFANDGPNQSNCTGECSNNWPPLRTEGNPQAGQGVDPNLIGSAPLDDGTQIVTYNQRPLYYWAQDSEPGQASGHGVGGIWFVVSPTGDPIEQ
jgi:predicted lipoprotein with Yx(FWY)xxD motif